VKTYKTIKSIYFNVKRTTVLWLRNNIIVTLLQHCNKNSNKLGKCNNESNSFETGKTN